MIVFCECNSLDCGEIIDASIEELQKDRKGNQVVLSGSCKRGPETTDTLIAIRDGYRVYQAQKP